jgi:hypothetical protein
MQNLVLDERRGFENTAPYIRDREMLVNEIAVCW